MGSTHTLPHGDGVMMNVAMTSPTPGRDNLMAPWAERYKTPVTCRVPVQRQGCDQGRYGGGRLAVMVVRTLAFVIVRRALGLVGLGPAPDAKDIEIAVLRHRLMVVRRQVARPRYAPADRMVLAVLARLVPRQRWPVFLVTPATLLRWHRELVARRWTYGHAGRGQQGLNAEVVDLVVRMAEE